MKYLMYFGDNLFQDERIHKKKGVSTFQTPFLNDQKSCFIFSVSPQKKVILFPTGT
jgi:hypothetical protein